MPSRAQAATTPFSNEVVSNGFRRFCTLTTSTIRRARPSSSTLTLDRPTWRILPCCWRRASAPTESSNGTFESGACSW